MDPNFIQRRMQELQQNEDVANAFGRLVSGKSNYKAVIEKKPVILKCANCSTILDECEKFCHECGTKVEKVMK